MERERGRASTCCLREFNSFCCFLIVSFNSLRSLSNLAVWSFSKSLTAVSSASILPRNDCTLSKEGKKGNSKVGAMLGASSWFSV